jgi:hypothetical protein
MELKANNLQIKKSLNGDTELIFSVADKDNKIAKLISEDTTLKEFIKLKFEKWREKRSLDANAYMWVLLGKIAEHESIKSTAEELYKKYIKNVGVYEIMPIKTIAVDAYINRWTRNGKGWFCEVLGESKLAGYTNVITYFGSSSYDSAEMARVIKEIIIDAKELGIQTATPEEQQKMLSLMETNNGLQK